MRALVRPRRSVLGLVLMALAAGPTPIRVATGSVTVTLAPTGPTGVSQGQPFSFSATANNPDAQDATVDVLMELGPGAVDFYRWTVTVPALGSAQTKLSVIASQWFAELGTYQLTPLIQDQPAGSPLPFEVTAPTVVVPVFEDVTAQAGLETTLPPPDCYRFAAGAAWGDVDGDGLLDLFVPSPDGPSQLWMQDVPGHFTEQAALRGADDGGLIGMASVFVDYENDGDQDLYVVNDGPNRLYQNDGTGHFTDVGPAAGVDDPRAGTSAAWGDYDADGWLDLYVTNYIDCTHPSGQPDRLYHAEGDGTFTDQTGLLEKDGSTTGVGFQAAWFDYDHDGDQDLYLANDKLPLGNPGNHLWRNDGLGLNGKWRFTDVSAESGTDYEISSMGIGLGDYDRDLDVDLAISNVQGNVLARNNADGTFTEVASQVRVARPFQNADQHSITWGLAFYDLNLDGWEDLYVAAGPIYGNSGQPNELFVNDRGRFLDLSAPSGAADPSVARGVAFADYDGDGLIDMYVVNQWGSPRLFHNVSATDGLHWLEVDTVGASSNRDGCGARLTLTVGTVKLLREVSCGSVSLASGVDPTVHFGIGAAETVSKLVVEWPSGVRQVLRNLAGDRRIVVTEPGS